MKFRDLPLVSLRAFAVVAESGSVTNAAEALGVTHSAVSKQVKLLERWLGQILFIVEGRKLVLTPFGEILSEKLNTAFEEISDACSYVQRQRKKRVITVEAPASFAMYWLLPRVSGFRMSDVQTDVWVSTRMTGQSPNFTGHDVVVVRGESAAPPKRMTNRVPLFFEDITVLCSQKLLALKPLSDPSDVLNHDLIGTMTRPQDWDTWLRQAKLPNRIVAGGHRFDHLFVAIQAVRDGLGLTVAPKNLFKFAIAANELVCPFPRLAFQGEPYFAYFSDGSIDPVVKRFKDWLVQEALMESEPIGAQR